MDQLYDTEPGQPRVPLRATPEGYLLVQIAGGGGGGGSSVTNLTTTVSPTNVVVASDTGTDATIPLADVTNAGVMPPAAVTQLAGLGTASEADVGDFAAADHTHTLLMTTGERTKLGALPAAADLTTSLAGKMANTLPAMQTAFDGGTALEKATFRSSVSGGFGIGVPFASFPAASTAGSGALMWESTFGVLMRSDGAYWRPAGGRQLLSRLAADWVMSASGALQIADSITVPPGMIAPGASLDVAIGCDKINGVSDTLTIRLKVGGQAVLAPTLATTIVSAGGLLRIKRVSATSIQKCGASSSATFQAMAISSTSSRATALTVPNMDTTPTVIELSGQMTSGATEYGQIHSYTIELVG
jgi:hypothetical protein